jgi:hypothetical protein
MHVAALESFYGSITAGGSKTKGIEVIRSDTEVVIGPYEDHIRDLKSVMRNLSTEVTVYIFEFPSVGTLFVCDSSNTDTSLTKPGVLIFVMKREIYRSASTGMLPRAVW